MLGPMISRHLQIMPIRKKAGYLGAIGWVRATIKVVILVASRELNGLSEDEVRIMEGAR
mgnify:CR=1 FL=1